MFSVYWPAKKVLYVKSIQIYLSIYNDQKKMSVNVRVFPTNPSQLKTDDTKILLLKKKMQKKKRQGKQSLTQTARGYFLPVMVYNLLTYLHALPVAVFALLSRYLIIIIYSHQYMTQTCIIIIIIVNRVHNNFTNIIHLNVKHRLQVLNSVQSKTTQKLITLFFVEASIETTISFSLRC